MISMSIAGTISLKAMGAMQAGVRLAQRAGFHFVTTQMCIFLINYNIALRNIESSLMDSPIIILL